jgi:hypothetical protein
MNVLDIVKSFLVAHGYDGLCDQDVPCGCGLDDLCTCGERMDECVPALKRKATKEEAEEAECQEGDEIFFEAPEAKTVIKDVTKEELLAAVGQITEYAPRLLGMTCPGRRIKDALRQLINERFT